MFRLKPTNFLLTVIALQLSVTIYLGYQLNIWMDEASSLHTTENGLLETFRNVFQSESQAPLYFWLLAIWRIASGSIFWARLLSIISSAVAVKFFFDLARKFFTPEETYLLTAFFAFHPFLIWTSVEIRCYSLVILLSILLLKFFWESFIESEPTRPRKMVFVFAAIIAVYTQYYLGFLLVGFFAALIVTGRFRAAKEFIFWMIPAAIAIAPLINVILAQFNSNAAGFTGDRSVIEGMRSIWHHFLSHIFPTELSPTHEQTAASFLRVWIVRIGALVVIVQLIRTRFRLFDSNTNLFAAIFVSIGVLLLVAHLLLGDLYTSLRHTALWLVPTIIFVGSIILRAVPKRAWILLAIGYAIIFCYSNIQNYPSLAKRGDWIRVARFIESNEKKEGQKIIIFRNYTAMALPYHYRGVNRILPDTNFTFWNYEDSLTKETALHRETEYIISLFPKDADEIWLATESLCQEKETMPACHPLEKFVAENYTVVEDRSFYFERVRLLRKK